MSAAAGGARALWVDRSARGALQGRRNLDEALRHHLRADAMEQDEMVPSDYEDGEEPGAPKSRPSAASPRCHTQQEGVSGQSLCEQDGGSTDDEESLLGDGTDEGMVSGDEAEAARAHLSDTEGELNACSSDNADPSNARLVDALCKANKELSEVKNDGHSYSRTGLTLAQVVRGIALQAYGRDKPVSGIYMLTNTVNGKKYVGQSKDILARWYAHGCSAKGKAKNNCRALNGAIAKYGWACFRKEILCIVGLHALHREEARLIAVHGTRSPLGYNLTDGGEMTPFCCAEVQARASSAKVELWDQRFEEQMASLPREEAERQRRKRDARLRAKHRFKAKQRGEHVEPISKEAANATRLAASNGEYGKALRKATYERKREERRTGNLRAN